MGAGPSSQISHVSDVASVSYASGVSTYNGKIVLTPYEEVEPRLDAWDFYDDTYQFDLFIQGYRAIQDRSYEDMKSFYQVSGIHGLPYTAYDGVTSHNTYKPSEWSHGRFGGYCHHGDVLFPSWHRPYVMLIEALIIEEAKLIAEKYPSNEKEKYVKAAKKLRHPYFDWAGEKAVNGLPEYFYKSELEINTPTGKNKIKNPLKSYTLPVDLSQPLAKGHNPNDKPHYIVPNTTYNPFTPKGYPTVRYPNPNYEDQYDLLNFNMSIYVNSVFKPSIYQMFQVDDYLHFSNHAVTSDDRQLPDSFSGHPTPTDTAGFAHFASVETPHDGFHLISGGLGGHMAYVDLTTFDPLFYFHHANVDRFLALWQAVYPNSWVPKNVAINGTFTDEMYSTVDEFWDLTPFRKSETEFWNSADVRDIEKLGYTYPELQKFKGKDPKELHNYLFELYKPDPHFGRRFFVKVTIAMGKLIGPYYIRVFVDLYNADAKTPVTSPHFAGLIAMWNSINNFQANSTSYIVGSVDITAAMERLGIRNVTHEYSEETNPITGELNSTAIFNVDKDITLVPVMLDGKGVTAKEAGVSNIEVYTFLHDKVNPNFLVKNSGELIGSKKF
ncbi:6657_t:CDS:2 [Scutellospora calospora]|uniref:6657_t:CDS:1 n=1 Tax=Scutellospora calospora TaxID=85575 RepID=A0ACA9K9U4_9GLOM|nr:6657_t:CDS:2 [Scutellospora calospora]